MILYGGTVSEINKDKMFLERWKKLTTTAKNNWKKKKKSIEKGI